MGKFYELFNMDAAVGVKELGLIYMKVNHNYCEPTNFSYEGGFCKSSNLVILKNLLPEPVAEILF